ncbi:MAG: diguanylate cyclase [Pelosinus sp.]|nr:diguanylate cyclase [Pelosinus sp.]
MIIRSKIAQFMVLFSIVLFVLIWMDTLSKITLEKQTEIQSTMRINANLAKAFEEHVRSILQEMDQVLIFIKDDYEKYGSVTPDMVHRIENIKTLPTLHISVIDEKGNFIASSRSKYLGINIADREYFNIHRMSDSKELYFSKPFIGRVEGKWMFHVSRRINKPDGSFGGIAVIGVEPLYFSNFYSKMSLGKNDAISIVGRDGIIRVRQTGEKMDVGTDVSNSPLHQHVQKATIGSYVNVSVIDNSRRINSYIAMPDYPLILTISALEADALSDYYHRQQRYYFTASIVSLFITLTFSLLIWMVLQKENMADELRRKKESLEITVEERTRQIQDAYDEQQAMNDELQAMNDELQRLSNVDGLTGIANRRYLNDYLERECHAALRLNKPLALIMVDIDFFKAYNDTYGHQHGDECLKIVATTLAAGVNRSTDLVARYGGEEFVVILPNTDADGAMLVAEKLRLRVEEQYLLHKKSPTNCVTISLGAAITIHPQEFTPLHLINAADQALYQAKREGRNCVRLYTQLNL